MTAERIPSGLRVEMLVRSHAPGGAYDRQRDLINRLRHLEETGTIESFTIEVWGRSVAIPADGIQDAQVNDALERVTEFEAWAEQNGHTLEPAFRQRTATSLITDEIREEVVFPIICIAVYEDEDLQAVFPCSEVDRVQTVEDCLTQLETWDDEVEDEPTDQSGRQPLEVER